MAFFGGAEGARLEPASSLSERVSARALRNCALHGLGLANRNVRNPGHLQRKLRTKAATTAHGGGIGGSSSTAGDWQAHGLVACAGHDGGGGAGGSGLQPGLW